VQAAGTLELVAEVAVAFAGFSGIVGVYRARTDAASDPLPALRVLVEYSVYLLAAALLPLFLWHGGLSETSAWRLASLASALYTATYYLYRYRSFVASASESEWKFLRAMIACDWLLAALLVVNAAGLFPFNPIVVYLVNLGYQLAWTAITFMRFVAPLWRAAA
jgi:hypothetical protein